MTKYYTPCRRQPFLFVFPLFYYKNASKLVKDRLVRLHYGAISWAHSFFSLGKGRLEFLGIGVDCLGRKKNFVFQEEKLR